MIDIKKDSHQGAGTIIGLHDTFLKAYPVDEVTTRRDRVQNVSVSFPPGGEANGVYDRVSEYAQRRTEFFRSVIEQGTPLFFHAAGGGLGDTLSSMRRAFAAARTLPNTPITVIGLRDRGLLPYLDIPQNVTYVSDISDIRVFPDWPTIQFTHTSTYFSQGLSHRFTADDVPTRAQLYEWGDRINEFNLQDVSTQSALRAVGVPIKPRDIVEPLVYGDRLPRTVRRGMLVIPEAKEGGHSSQRRSRKSLSPERWLEVFQFMKSMGFNDTIGIVEGHFWLGYTERVLVEAFRAGLEAEHVRTPNLGVLCEEVAQSGRIVAMDTGPMHLAVETVKAIARDQNQVRTAPPSARVLFNSLIASPDIYGPSFPADLGIDGEMYVHSDGANLSFRHDNHLSPGIDMDNAPPFDIATFIMSSYKPNY